MMYAYLILVGSCVAMHIRDQLPSWWSLTEKYRVRCPDGRGKGRCYDYCWNGGMRASPFWLEEHCLPRLRHDDMFILERSRRYTPRWAHARYDIGGKGFYMDLRNTTFRTDVLERLDHVVKVDLVSTIYFKGYQDNVNVFDFHWIRDATDLPAEAKAMDWDRNVEPDDQQMWLASGYDSVYETLPTLEHPDIKDLERPHLVNPSEFATNVTALIRWYGVELPDEMLLIYSQFPHYNNVEHAPYFDVSEWVWVSQIDKCQRHGASCQLCQTQTNCEWCLLPNLTYACTGMCAEPWIENVCGAADALKY
eukprot:Protomagalhaensia_sp_Gyna_25__2164@NODE_2177_length_1239_cov_133_593333_g1800_i0_p1_GENE_NODE_2177_length_1239_cov_133_593333_g1800_i0NODE_2177_length_1239_cov_133_593333_g1800_i0_p1_ORF_typecomplete_len307_score37_46_NODE_2177_length_1239_cov_133_593333_g1800_i0941014